MDMLSAIESVFVRGLAQENRPLRLRFAGQAGAMFEGVIAPQRLEVSEGICESTVAHVTCLSTHHLLPLDQFTGLPVEIGMVTDVGDLRRINAIILEVRQGQSDGGVTILQFKAGDIFSLMEGRRSNRVFLNKSAPEIARIVLDGWRKRFPALARAFDYSLLGIDESKYPKRAFTFQAHQSDADFLRMLFKRNGIAWFFRPGKDPITQELVLFDDASQLPANVAGAVRYHRRDMTEPFDSITLLAPTHTLVGGRVTRSSWDHETGEVSVATETNIVDQGEVGTETATALVDARIDIPHAGDSLEDHARLTRVDMQRLEGRAQCLHGVGGVRAQAVGEWNRIDGNAVLDALTPEDREYTTIHLSTWCENSYQKELNELVQRLVVDSERSIRGWAARSGQQDDPDSDNPHRHVNRFVAVRRDSPILPEWDPQVDLPRMGAVTATVVGPADQPVWCDKLGRVKVRIHGLDPDDHEHADGAGTNGDDTDSAWVRVNFLWCGDGFGIIFPLRPGMEVSLGFEHGDPSRPMIVGARYNATHLPPRFDHLGELPDNGALSGIVTREFGGDRQQQLRFNDTKDNISAQLATDHGATQLNLGSLSTAMDKGKTQPRGDGFEVRTDLSGAIRAADSLLVSVWAQPRASRDQMEAEGHFCLMDDQRQLTRSLAQYAAQNQAIAIDTEAVTQLEETIKAGTSGTLILTAPGGGALTTGGALAIYAGATIDTVARQHLQFSSGGHCCVNASQGLSLFTQSGGLRAIANQGEVLVQSQHDETRIEAATNIIFSAVGGTLVGQAKGDILLKTEGGAYLKLSGGNVEVGGPGSFIAKTVSHNWAGPSGANAQLSLQAATPKPPYDEMFVVQDKETGEPVAHVSYWITDGSGKVIGQGMTDEQGRARRAYGDGAEQIHIFY